MILISNQEKGYFITATINHGSYIPEALHVERIDDMALYDGDFEAAKAAEQDGVRLIYGMDGIPDGIYIDTPENRELIRKGRDCILTIETGGMTLIRHLLRS